MDKLTWPGTIVLVIVIWALAYMFNNAGNSEMQATILGYLETVITFLIGGASGGAIAGGTLYGVGYGRGLRANQTRSGTTQPKEEQ